jgi:hypothetical protein
MKKVAQTFLDPSQYVDSHPETWQGIEGNKYPTAYIPLQLINIGPQTRKTFKQDSLEELASDISIRGLLTPLRVCVLDEESFRAHLEYLNNVFRKRLGKDRLSPEDAKWQYFIGADGNKYYAFLEDGERRFRAFDIYKEKSPEDFDQNFPYGLPCTPEFNRNPEIILQDQLSANLHEKPPIHEEMETLGYLYRAEKESGAVKTITEFAKKHGKDPESVRRAAWYVDLPLTIQHGVEKGKITYGVAVEIYRLKLYLRYSDRKLVSAYRQMLPLDLTADTAKVRIDSIIRDVKIGQGRLLGEDDFMVIEVHSRQTIIKKRLGFGIKGFLKYCEHTLEMRRDKIISAEDLPIQDLEFLNDLLSASRVARESLGCFGASVRKLKKGEIERAEMTFDRMARLCEESIEVLIEEKVAVV